MAVHSIGVADTKADLYATISSDGIVALLMGNNTRGDQAPVEYLYDGASVAADSYPLVIQPTMNTGPGRWVRTKQTAPQRQEAYTGTTDGSGNYTVTFATPFPATPNIQANIIGGTNTQSSKITAVSATGFTVNVVNRTDVVGLLPSYSVVSGVSIHVLITQP